MHREWAAEHAPDPRLRANFRGSYRGNFRGGFTLVEVVLATALGALLLVALLGVTASLGRSQKAFEREAGRDEGPLELIELLRRDLAAAQEARLGKGRIELIGYGALDPAALEPAQRPAKVVYRLLAEPSCLVREQTPLDENNARPWREVVGWGVSGFDAQPVLAQGLRLSNTPLMGATGVPEELKFEVAWTSGRTVKEVIRLR